MTGIKEVIEFLFVTESGLIGVANKETLLFRVVTFPIKSD